jgi:hypothetical protein
MAELSEAERSALIEELDDAAPESYIIAAAEVLGFASPGIALALGTSMEDLMGFYAFTA